MAKDKRNKLLDYLVYLGLRTGVMVIQAFPFEVMQAVARGMGWLMFRIDKKHRQRAIEHLRQAFGKEWSEERIQDTALQCCQHMILLGMEILCMAKMINRFNWYRFVNLRNVDQVLRKILDDRGIMIITGHFGNWEVMGYTIGAVGVRTYAVARPIDNPYVERWFLKTREETGQTIISKFGATALLVRVIETQQPLCFLADQHAGARGIWVDFFGRPASTYKSIALLAMEKNCPIAVGGAWRVGDQFKFQCEIVDVIDPEDYKNDKDAVRSITARYTKSLETVIRKAPEQYLWMHRRWREPPPPRQKKSKPASVPAAPQQDAQG